MGEKQRDTSGRYSRSVDDAEVLAAVRAHDPAATSEVAEEVGISRQGTDRRLRALRDVGEVSSKKIGASLVWFMPRTRETRETAAHGDADAFDTDDLQGDATTTLDDDTGARAGESDGDDDVRDRAREILHGLNGRAGDGPDYERRVDAVLFMYDYLRSRPDERVTKGDFETALDADDVDTGYAGGFSGLWNNWVLPSDGRPENALAALPGVEMGANHYEYTAGHD